MASAASLAMAGSYCRYIDFGLCVSTGLTEEQSRLLSITHLNWGDVFGYDWLSLAVRRGAFEILSDQHSQSLFFCQRLTLSL